MDVRARQAPLRERYTEDPGTAIQRLRVHSDGVGLDDPLHAESGPVQLPDVRWRAGAHAAVGGAGDAPCSGDLLLGALAACQEITLRMVAANMGIAIESLTVDVEADWDPRGTLAMGRTFPVGIRAITCRTSVTIAEDANGERAERLLRSAERYCVVLDTLRTGVKNDEAPDTPGIIAARTAGIPFDVMRTERARSAEESASFQGIQLEQLLRTIVVRRGEDDYVFVLVPGGRRIDWAKLRTHLGVRRLSLPDADEARNATGYERGAITPFGSTHAWPVIADASIGADGMVAIGGGAHGVNLHVQVPDLVSATGAEVIDVTEPEPAA
jgi:Cys-tRNA(Pro)/Cys-tRNA(Cys) deacylase